MSLQEVLDANKRFMSGGGAGKVAGHSAKKAAVVCCMDPRLVDMLPKAMGFKRGDAYFIQNAGNTGTKWDEGVIRSLAIAIGLGGITEIYVIGHTECAMMTDPARVTEGLKKRGVGPDALGGRKPGEWFGVISSPEDNVRKMVNLIRNSPVVPKDVGVHGLMVDTHTGQLTSL
jgi:carbonic anhydrase